MSRANPRWVVAALAVLALAFWVTLRFGLRAPSGSEPGVSSSPAATAGPARPRPRGSWGGFRGIHLSDAVVESGEDSRLGAFSGRVISSGNQQPVAGAELTFVGPDGARAVKSGADGGFEFQPEREGGHEIALVTAEGFFPLSAELGTSPVTLMAKAGSGISGVTLRLDPAVEYRGLVVDPKDQPAPGARVRVVGGDELELGGESFQADHVADAQGAFSFRAPDGALLEARHDGFGPGRARLDASAQISHRIRIRLTEKRAEQGQAIRGRVVDEEGTPRVDVPVVARIDAANPAAEVAAPPARTRSGEGGEFLLDGLAPGAYSLLASDGTSAPAVLRGVSAGAADVTLVLTRGATLSGKVSDAASGAAVPAFSVILSQRRGPLALDTARAVTVFDAEGRYSIEHLRPGKYLMLVAAKGYAPLAEREIEVAGDTRADASLSRGATLRGVVRDAKSKQALEAAKVSLEGRQGGGEGSVQLFAVAVTDASGRFELEGLAPGQRSVFAAASKHHARVVGGIVVKASEALGPLEIELTPTEPGEEPRIELTGIGAILAAKDDAMLIGKVVEGGGAAEVGLKSGDAILAADGQSVVSLGFEGTINAIRGPEGSTVSLLVRRADAGAPELINVPRRRLKA